MKRLLLLLLALVSFVGFAQDVEYMKKIRSLDEQGAIDVATEIASMTRGDFELDLSKETKQGYFVRFLTKGIDKDVVLASPEKYPDDIIKVYFERFKQGDNKALEIEGTTQYNLHSVRFNYLDLFPYWQKYFAPNATLEDTIEDYKLQESRYEADNVHWLYKFKPETPSSKLWLFRRFY